MIGFVAFVSYLHHTHICVCSAPARARLGAQIKIPTRRAMFIATRYQQTAAASDETTSLIIGSLFESDFCVAGEEGVTRKIAKLRRIRSKYY
jgi:hypothetical protein